MRSELGPFRSGWAIRSLDIDLFLTSEYRDLQVLDSSSWSLVSRYSNTGNHISGLSFESGSLADLPSRIGQRNVSESCSAYSGTSLCNLYLLFSFLKWSNISPMSPTLHETQMLAIL